MQQTNISFDKLRQYYEIIKKLFVDSVLRFKGKSVLVLISGFLGITFQIQAIALAFYYAKAIEKGHVINLLGYSIDGRTSMSFLLLSAVGVLLSLSLSAWLVYFSRTGILKLMRQYEEFCVTRTFSFIGTSLRVWSAEEQTTRNDSIVYKLASTDARFCGRALMMLLKAIVPVITFVASAASLLYINALLTFFVFVFIAVSGIFQYRVNVRGARSTSLMEKYSKDVSGEYRNIIKRQRGTSVPLSIDSAFFGRLFNLAEVKRFFDASEWRYRALDSSRFISDLLLAVTIFTIIVILGSSLIIKGQGWGKLIIYLIALRYMLVSLKQSVSRVTGINRYFLQLKRYFHFLDNLEILSGSSGPVPERYNISGDSVSTGETGVSFEVKRGSRIGVISPLELNRYTVASITDSLLGSGNETARHALGSIWFITSVHGALPLSLKEAVGLPSDYTREQFQKDMEGSGLWGRMDEQLPHDLEVHISSEEWMKFDPDIKVALNMLSASYSSAQWVMIEEKALGSLSDDAGEFLLNRLSDRIIVIVYANDISSVKFYGAEMVAFIGGDSAVSLCSVEWVKENEGRLRDILCKIDTSLSVEKKGSRDEIDDDEIDDDEI